MEGSRVTVPTATPAIRARSWVRELWHPRSSDPRDHTGPEWQGRWHLATGDLAWRPTWNATHARLRCGRLVALTCGYGSDCHELVMLAVQPSIDVCRTCQRLSGREITA